MPKNLFDIDKNTCKNYIESRKEQSWIDPDHLPNFGNTAKYVESTENSIARAIVRKSHYFMDLLVIQNKKTILEPSVLEICKFIY